MKLSARTIAIAALAAFAILTLDVVTIWPEFMTFVERSGTNVPTEDAYLDFAQGVGWAAILGTGILLWPVSVQHRMMLLLMWLIRCFIMLIAMLPYEEHYPGLDCWSYFVGAHSIVFDPITIVQKGGSSFIMLLGALHLTIGPDSYHAMKVSYGYWGLAAIYLLYRSAAILMSSEARWTFWALGLYPSVLFWSSILGKDPVVLLGIAIHIWGLVRVIAGGEHKHLFTSGAGIALASIVRIWLGPILLVPALLLFALKIRKPLWRIATVTTVCALLAVLAPATANRLDIDPSADLFTSTQSFSRGWDHANSAIYTDVELNSLTDLILFAPKSVFAAYFRPMPGDLPHAFGFMAGCEDLILLLICAFALARLRFRHFKNHFFLWGVALLVVWGLAYSLVTYKDLGTAVRFRLQIIPVMLALSWFLIRPKKFSTTSKYA